MEERLGMSGEDICYLGDSFENDVVGAKAANWKAIWFNHRKRVEPIAPYQADKVVIDWDELVEVIQSF